MTAIEDFWDWFRRHEDALYADPEDEKLLDELDARLSAVHPSLGWELGPTSDGSMYFAVSPSLDSDLVPVAHNVVAKAYTSKKWQFVVGRQRRPWDDVLEMQWDPAAGTAREALDLANWKHIVFKNPDTGKLEILFESPVAARLTEDQRGELALIVAQSLIGELPILEQVESIELLARFDDSFRADAKPAAWLPYAFDMKPL